jgi:hypothetical protein
MLFLLECKEGGDPSSLSLLGVTKERVLLGVTKGRVLLGVTPYLLYRASVGHLLFFLEGDRKTVIPAPLFVIPAKAGIHKYS